ncbi:MAG: DUF4340 domain-containing protein [Spirochaetales bacterium]|nr:DUF4340 domain-containing protein [Spirochaetales bacterium]
MEFKQKVIIFGSIIGGLILLYIAGLVISNATFGATTVALFPELDAGKINLVTITDKNGSITLKKTGDQWNVVVQGKEFPGDNEEIEQLLKSVTSIKQNRIASQLPDTWTQFEVDPVNAVHTVLSQDENVLIDIYIGKSGSDGISEYVRLNNSDEVIQTADRIVFTSRTREWAAKKFIQEQVAINDLEAISIRSTLAFDETGNLDLAKMGTLTAYTIEHTRTENRSKFTVAGDPSATLSMDAVNQLLYAIYDFRTEDILVNPDQYPINTAMPLATVSLKLKGGINHTLSVVGRAKENNSVLYITDPARPYFYTSMSWSFKKVVPPLSSLIQPKPFIIQQAQ